MEIYSMLKGTPSPSKGKPRPHIWITGPDELRHKQYFIWLQQRNQARWRREEWNLDFDDWLIAWEDKWPKRGRTKGSYCMTRRDPFKPWDKDNVYTVERGAHSQRIRADREIYKSLTITRNSVK